MDSDRQQFLNLRNFPARLSALETAWMLGFSPRELSMLVGARMLKPLGRPPTKAPKFFHRVEVELLGGDRAWMAKACETILAYWKTQNDGRSADSEYASSEQ